jgi:molecular chaperone Hsp33
MTHGPDDLIQPFSIESSGLRGRLVRLGPAVDGVLSAHDYPPSVARLLGEMLALGGVMSSMLKFDGVFTLQTKGDGPVGMMVVDYTAEGKLRGYAQVDEARLAAEGLAEDAGDAPVPRLLGAGHLAFTVDGGPDSGKRYQGIVDIEGGTLAEVLQHYFRQSEQLPTGIHLAAEPVHAGNGNGGGPASAWRAGGLLLQRLPEDRPGTRSAAEHEEDWRRALILMASCTRGELVSPKIAPNELLFRLFHEDAVRVYRPRPVVTGCRCSQERVEKTLRRIPREELAELKIDGEVVVTCEFCNASYRFDDAALDRVYAS